jgi:hypothetical protein
VGVGLAPPLDLPGAGASASGAAGDWLIGLRPGVAAPAGADVVQPGTFRVPRHRARALAERYDRRGELVFAEPDRRVLRASAPDGNLGGWARGAVVPPDLAWPGGGPIGVIDDFVDPTVPDLQGHVGYLNATAQSTIDGPHGTEVASAAAGSHQSFGVTGVLPGAPIASYGVPVQTRCSHVASGIDAARVADLPVVNISLGSEGACFSVYLAAQKAYGTGTLVVASAGNDFQSGNPVIYPAAFPHVISVAAVDQQLRSAAFSSANAAVDVSAPGVDVPLATPVNFDDDGVTDGFTVASGTSFAAPMVAGAVAWLRAARPDLGTGQAADVIRYSARDLAAEGWDDDTGWGLVDVPAALRHPAPPVDPLEPNDGISFVDGRVFARPDGFVWRGRGSTRISAFADRVEDPIDVYRFQLRPRSRARITLAPRFGDADLAVLDQGARTTTDRRNLVCTSRLGPGRTDSCSLVWRGRTRRTGYVAITVAESREGLASGYRLRLRRR